MTDRQTLVVASDLANLPHVIEFVRQACRDAGLSEEETFACELATDEACTNIVEHAYQGRREGEFQLTCYRSQDSFVVRLHDHGVSFDPDSVPPPTLTGDLSQRRAGGLGLHFIYSLMDEVHFDFEGAKGNTLTMIKWLTSGDQTTDLLD